MQGRLVPYRDELRGLASLLLILLSPTLGHVGLPVVQLLSSHSLLPSISHLGHQGALLILILLAFFQLGGLLCSSILFILLLLLLLISFALHVSLDELGGFTLQTISHVFKVLVISSNLDLKKLFLHLVDDFDSLEFILLNLVGHVRDDQGDNDLQADDKMLNADGKEEDVGAVPVIGILLLKVLNQDRLLLEFERIQVLVPANWHRGETADQEDERVARDGEVCDKAHDRHPVANSTGVMCNISPSNLGHVLQLNLDFEKIGQEGEKWRKWERCSEEGDKAHLDHSFVVVGN